MMRILWLIIALVLMWGPMLPAAASGAVVGRISQVKGHVDLLKGGQLPATPVKVGDRVDAGDVLRSKSLSKAQITFIDNSIITISPSCRLAIEDYRFEPAQGKRWAVLKVFQGLAHVVVNKIFKVKEPDFIVKTHTAVTGVRGTDFGIRLLPNRSTILNFQGKTRVGSIFPEVHTWERRARKTAYQQPPPSNFFVPGAYVDLEGMQGTTVQADLPPTLPYALTSLDRKMFLHQVAAGLGTQGKSSGSDQVAGPGGGGGISNSGSGGVEYVADLGSSATGGITPTSTTATTVPAFDSSGLTGSGNTTLTTLNTVTVPPTVVPVAPTSTGGGSTPPPGPTPSTFTFTQQYYGAFLQSSASPYNQSTLLGYSWGERTGVYEGYFYALTEGTRSASGETTYAALNTGTVTASSTGTVTGVLGGTLTGTMELTATTPSGSTVTRTGNVTLLATGELTYDWTDTVVDSGGNLKGTGSGSTSQTPGTYFTQTISGQETTETNLAGNQATSTNYGDLNGTRVMDGISTDIKAAFSVTNTATTANSYSSDEPHDVTITSEGVLGAPDANGVRVGVMTNTAVTAEDTSTSGGPVREVPASGDSPQATFSTVIGNSSADSGSTSLGVSAQTSNLSATIGTQTYEGSGTLTSSPPYTTGSYNSTGWGIGSGTGPEGPETVPLTGSLAVTVNRTGGTGTFDPTSTDAIHLNTASVVAPNSSGNYQGPSQGVGIAGENGDNTVVTTTGTTTANVSTGVATSNFSGAWVEPNSKGTLNNGTQTMTPGTYFTQTGNSGTVTLSTPTATTPSTQTGTLAATMTRTGVAPGPNQVLTPSSVITSTTNNAAAFPAAGAAPANINIQGVVGPSGAGNMTMTIDKGPGTAVSTYKGPVAIDSGTGNLTANNLVGKNPANPGVNRVEAKQTGTVASQPSP